MQMMIKNFKKGKSLQYFNLRKNLVKNINIIVKNFTWKVDYSFDTRDFLKKVNEYESKINDVQFVNESSKKVIRDEVILGQATEDGTIRFSERNKEEVHAEHFKTFYGTNWKVGSIGLGTYMGPPDDINDFYIYNAVKSCVLSGGVNMIDTAINYRYMKSERAVGKAISTLCQKYEYDRNEFVISSKIGYVPEDADNGKRCHAFVQHLIEGNIISMEDIIFDDKKRPVHCIHPAYLNEQLNLSLANLGLKTIDILYLHNVVESQGAIMPADQFMDRLAKAFEFLVYYTKYY